MNSQQKTALRLGTSHVLLIFFLVLVLVPYLIVVSTSLRRGNFAPSGLLPDKVSLEHWKYVLGIPYQEVVNTGTGETRIIKAETPPLLWFWNSIKISAVASVGIILLSGTAAYAFSRLHFKFKAATLGSLLILQMFPMVLALVAIYVILDFTGQYVHWLGLNTQLGLIMVYLGGISGYIWMIKGYFDTIPASMEESGANSFLPENQQLWGRFSALAVLSGVPITIMFLVCQKYIVGGLTSGGVKE
jgi:maltose/maltodextrin transport system permease protein